MKGKVRTLVDIVTGEALLPVTVSDAVIHNGVRVSTFLEIALPTYIYVSPNGNDTNSGTSDYPLLTIEAAVEKASSLTNAAIVLLDGSYTLPMGTTITSSRNVTLII